MSPNTTDYEIINCERDEENQTPKNLKTRATIAKFTAQSQSKITVTARSSKLKPSPNQLNKSLNKARPTHGC